MATPPITSEKTLELAPRRRGLARRVVTRGAWLAADLVAIGACAALAVSALT